MCSRQAGNNENITSEPVSHSESDFQPSQLDECFGDFSRGESSISEAGSTSIFPTNLKVCSGVCFFPLALQRSLVSSFYHENWHEERTVPR
jgi:hypothetical protein